MDGLIYVITAYSDIVAFLFAVVVAVAVEMLVSVSVAVKLTVTVTNAVDGGEYVTTLTETDIEEVLK